MFEDMFRDIPKELVRESKLPGGGTIREMGPFVYGYSFSVGPDGKPVIREFGNVKPRGGFLSPRLDFKEEREPLVDTIVQDDVVKVVAEVPGVEKDDIKLNISDRNLTISVDTSKRKYFRELELAVEVDPDTSKASYKNGILELTLNRRKPRAKGRAIRIE